MLKTAVVTGAASGIGRRTVERLLADGWSVWGLDLSIRVLTDQAISLGAGDRYRVRQCDVSQFDSVEAVFADIAVHGDSIDALVCSAGVALTGSLEGNTVEEVDRMLGVNVKGPWLTVRQALPLLKRFASPDAPSRVVMVGSIGGIRPKVGSGFYAATKAALHVITGIFAVELAPAGIIVNAVAPGSVATPMLESATNAKRSPHYKPSGISPLGRIAQPDDIADVILFFLSDAARYINGTVLPVDGGSRAAFVKD